MYFCHQNFMKKINKLALTIVFLTACIFFCGFWGEEQVTLPVHVDIYLFCPAYTKWQMNLGHKLFE